MATPTIFKTTSSSPSLSAPKGIAIDSDLHRLLICDSGNDRLVYCYLDGIKQISTKSTYGVNSFNAPGGALYHGGYFYVSDTDNHVVVRLRARDLAYKDHFGTVGSSGSTNAKLNSPTGLATDGRFLYIADTGNNRIMKLVLSTLAYSAKTSSINGALSSPFGICYKRVNGEALFVSDTANNRVVKCQTDFTYIEQNSSDVTTPVMLAHDNDYIYVVNGGAGNDDIVILASDGLTSLTTFEDTTITLSTPYGIAINRNAMFITDGGNNRVTVWKTYDPRDDFTSATVAKFGGVFFDNPLIIVDDDQLIVGATQEYGSPNRWVEENPNNYSTGWVEE